MSSRSDDDEEIIEDFEQNPVYKFLIRVMQAEFLFSLNKVLYFSHGLILEHTKFQLSKDSETLEVDKNIIYTWTDQYDIVCFI